MYLCVYCSTRFILCIGDGVGGLRMEVVKKTAPDDGLMVESGVESCNPCVMMRIYAVIVV